MIHVLQRSITSYDITGNLQMKSDGLLGWWALVSLEGVGVGFDVVSSCWLLGSGPVW